MKKSSGGSRDAGIFMQWQKNILSLLTRLYSEFAVRGKRLCACRCDGFRELFFEEMKLPDIRGRHLITAKLRIVIFVVTWIVFFVFFPAVWKIAPVIPVLFNLGFLITSFCYYQMIKNNQPSLSIILLEIFADIVSQTVIIYLLGVKGWAPFLIYGMYIVALGILSGYYAALISSIMALFCYNFIYFLIISGGLADFAYPQTNIGYIDFDYLRPFLNLFFLPLIFIGIVYSVRIANYFTRVKEQVLERRNIQLTALNHIGATIRRVLNAPKVIDEVLKAVIQGLGFDVCFL
ncbi:MAG TPA: hypothetical protein VJC18_05075, partial [bacterium]|nr:hypothetical protein [bacterium]